MIQLVGTLIAVGILLWLANHYLAAWIDPVILKIINVVVVIAVLVFVLRAFGILPLASLPVPQVR